MAIFRRTGTLPLTGCRMQVGQAEIAFLGQDLASLRAVNRSSDKCNIHSCDGPWRVYNTLVAGERPSLLMVGNKDEVYDK